MSLYGMMRTSASGMNAQANRLGAVSDNIANSSTTSYKAASVEFSSLVLEAGTSDYAPGAVESHIRHNISQQGAFNYTSSVTDLALKGDGFFIVQGSDGRNLLTRAGSFVKDGKGDLVNAAGFKLLGYDTRAGDAGSVVNGTASLVPVNVSTLTLQAAPSTTGNLTVNVPSGGAVISAGSLPSDNVSTSSYAGKTSMVTYDNLGTQVVLDAYWANKGGGSWEVSVYDRSTASASGGFPYSGAALTSTTVSFDPTTGKLVTPSALTVNIPNGSPFSLDISKSTQLAADYTILNASANGNAPSGIDQIEISDTGILSTVLQNGSRISAYRIPIGTVISPDNLISVGGNTYLQSENSGALQIGSAGSSGRGSIVSSALEQSTVDLASQLTDMIQAQSSYTANSKVFQTGADLVAVLNNLRS